MDLSNQSVYLRPNAVIEPLVNRWYAWPHLIAPATACMFVANHHLKVMQSFVTAPQIHVEALKKPEMLGGPFINYGADRVADVKALLDKTSREQADLLELAAAIKALDELLAAEATGFSLEPLYARVPAALRGMVELVYDLGHRAYFRVIEPLLYRTPFYKPTNQSLALHVAHDDSRAFALSTPRLDEDGVAFVDVPFADPVLDELARARLAPKPLGFFTDVLRAGPGRQIEPLFTECAPNRPGPFEQEGLRIRYLGHACILVESKRCSVLTDPIVPYATGGCRLPRLSFGDLPDTIDYVVITHNHQDHALFETLLQLRHRVRHVVVPRNAPGNLADPSLKLMFRQLGFKSVLELDELEKLDFDGGSIMALPFLGEHGDLDVRSKCAHLIEMEGHKILCAADSNNVEPELYRHVQAVVGAIEVLFLGMECQGAPMSWLYGPLFSKPIMRKHDQSRRLDGSNCDKALDMVERLEPKHVYVYAMGAEPWIRFISSIEYTTESRPIVESDRLVQECRQRGIVSERLLGAHDIVLS